jgi:hypothetical protein
MNDFMLALEALGPLANVVLAVCAVFVSKSVSELNTRIAVVVERVDSHEKRITRIENVGP